MASSDLQPPDSEADRLRAELTQLRAAFTETKAVAPAEWRLTPTEERVFRVMLACDTAGRAAIAAGASLGETRTIDVHLLRIRDKLTRFGVEIETVRGKGWRLVGREAWSRTLQPKAA
jgi:DNA-binding response OmpR family regulator